MRYLLRRTKHGIWAGAERDRVQAIRALARTDADTDGLSVFEVSDEKERALVVAAIACGRGNMDRVDLLEIDEATLAELGGGSAKPTPGTTPVAAANALHRSLDWSAEDLRCLAERLFDAGVEPRKHGKAEVCDAVRGLEEADVEGELARDLVRRAKARG